MWRLRQLFLQLAQRLAQGVALGRVVLTRCIDPDIGVRAALHQALRIRQGQSRPDGQAAPGLLDARACVVVRAAKEQAGACPGGR